MHAGVLLPAALWSLHSSLETCGSDFSGGVFRVLPHGHLEVPSLICRLVDGRPTLKHEPRLVNFYDSLPTLLMRRPRRDTPPAGHEIFERRGRPSASGKEKLPFSLFVCFSPNCATLVEEEEPVERRHAAGSF